MNYFNRCATGLGILVALAPMSIYAAATLPTWYNPADTTQTHLTHLFDSDDLTPAPNGNVNANGTPVTTVTLGTFSDGWQAPNTIQQSGTDLDSGTAGRQTDGAWDLGQAGAGNVSSIQSEINIAAAAPQPGMFYDIEFQVYAIAFDSLTPLPEFSIAGLTAVDTSFTQMEVEGGLPLGASWEGMTWTGTLKNVNTDNLTFSFNTPTGAAAGSVIDSYEIFTRYTVVPEPSTSVMMLGSLLVLVTRRNRRS